MDTWRSGKSKGAGNDKKSDLFLELDLLFEIDVITALRSLRATHR